MDFKRRWKRLYLNLWCWSNCDNFQRLKITSIIKKERIFLYSYLTNNSCRPATNLFLVLFMIYLKFDLKCQKVPHTSIYVWYLFASENLHQTSHETHSLVMLRKLHCSCPQMSSSIVIDLHASGIFPSSPKCYHFFWQIVQAPSPIYNRFDLHFQLYLDCLLQILNNWLVIHSKLTNNAVDVNPHIDTSS